MSKLGLEHALADSAKSEKPEQPQTLPEDQFQIGDKVLFIPHGIITEVIGYHWVTVQYLSDKNPIYTITGYKLACGVDNVAYKDLERL